LQNLAVAGARYGGILATAAATARDLLTRPREISVLHGDIHHGNILWFGHRGWLAIDPKGLIGERGFDYTNLFCNPDPKTAIAPRLFARRVEIVAETARLDRERLLRWILAGAGLSSTWLLDEGLPGGHRLKVAELAAAALHRARR
jgi:streptomycin 6-kinase